LAPITNVTEDELPGLVKRMAERISAEPQAGAAKLWTATYLLMGLRYSNEFASHLLRGVRDMRESTTYQAIRSEGRDEGLIEGCIAGERRVLLRLGTKNFGTPAPAILHAIEAFCDVDRLEALCERMLDSDVDDWNRLLAAPGPQEQGD
jgi:predicted transposase YdaD